VQAIREQLAQSNALELSGRYKDQLPILEKALADVGQIKYRPIEAEVLLGLAVARQRTGAPKEAETLAYNAIFAAEAGRHDELAAQIWMRLALWQSALEGHELDRARISVSHAGALLERMGGNEARGADLDMARGNIEYEAGNYDKALEHYKAALLVRERILGPAHTEVASALEAIAMTVRYQGHLEEALAYSKRSLALREKNLGLYHPLVSKSLTTIGLTLEGRGEFVEARKFHERALAITEKAYGPEHSNTAIALMNLANTVGDVGTIDEAIALYTRALAIQEKQFGVGHVKTANILQNIGATLTQVGRFQDALAYFERALAITEKAKGPSYVELCLPLSNLGSTLVHLKRFDEAEERFQRALELARKTHGDKHPYIADALVGIAQIHIERHQALKAIPLLEEALTMRMTLEEDPLLIAEARFELGRALWDAGKDKLRSVDLIKEAQKSYSSSGNRQTTNTAEVDTWLRTHTLH
jgi:tetratricopeptide (TPR) repeat protein